MRRLALLTLVTCACGVAQVAPVTHAPSVRPEPTVVHDADVAGSVRGLVRHSSTDAALGNAIVVLQSSGIPALEVTTDEYGRYAFSGLPAGTYTVQVLVGQADVSKVFTLPDSANFRANFSVDPENAFTCRLPTAAGTEMDRSLLSLTNPTEARLWQRAVTHYGL